MFKFACFSWVLEFIYKVSRLSGFIYTNIDFKPHRRVVIKKSFINTIVFMLGIGLNFLANWTYDAYLSIADVTHSKLMEIAVNTIVKMLIWSSLLLKVINVFQSQRFFEIVEILQWGDKKVLITRK